MKFELKKIAIAALTTTMSLGMMTSVFAYTTNDDGEITDLEKGESLVVFCGSMSASGWNTSAEKNIMTAVEGCDGVVSYTATFKAYDDENEWASRFALLGNYNDGENLVLGAWSRLLLGEPSYKGELEYTNCSNISIRPTKATEVTVYFDTRTSTVYCQDSAGNDMDYYVSWVGIDDEEVYMKPKDYAATTYEDYYNALTTDERRNELDEIDTEKTIFSDTYLSNIEGLKKYVTEGIDYYKPTENRNGWFLENSNKYYYESNQMVIGWKEIKNAWYYFDEDGVMETGWQPIDDNWYFFDKSGVMQTGWKKANGKWYYLNTSGAMTIGWKKINSKWYYFNATGSMATGWKKLSGKWYYFETSGKMVSNTTMTINGKSYTFNSSGVMV